MSMSLDIRFDKRLVDWINVLYPERVWISSEGTNTMGVGFDIDVFYPHHAPARANEIVIEPMALGSDFDTDISLFFDKNERDLKMLLKKVCEGLIIDTKAGAIIYLYGLVGNLIYSGDTTIYANWVLRLHIDHEGTNVNI